MIDRQVKWFLFTLYLTCINDFDFIKIQYSIRPFVITFFKKAVGFDLAFGHFSAGNVSGHIFGCGEDILGGNPFTSLKLLLDIFLNIPII